MLKTENIRAKSVQKRLNIKQLVDNLMIKYFVRYELVAKPSNVSIYIECLTKDEADKIFDERKKAGNCLNVEILEKTE